MFKKQLAVIPATEAMPKHYVKVSVYNLSDRQLKQVLPPPKFTVRPILNINEHLQDCRDRRSSLNKSIEAMKLRARRAFLCGTPTKGFFKRLAMAYKYWKSL